MRRIPTPLFPKKAVTGRLGGFSESNQSDLALCIIQLSVAISIYYMVAKHFPIIFSLT